MADKGFGADLWKNMQAVRIDEDGTFRAPIHADGRNGITIGVDAVAQREAAGTVAGEGAATSRRPTRSLLARLLRR